MDPDRLVSKLVAAQNNRSALKFRLMSEKTVSLTPSWMICEYTNIPF